MIGAVVKLVSSWFGGGQYRGDSSGNDGAWRDARAQGAGIDDLHEFDRFLDES